MAKKIDKIRSLKQHFPFEFNWQSSGWLPAQQCEQQSSKSNPSSHTYIPMCISIGCIPMKDVQIPSKIISLAIIYHLLSRKTVTQLN
jgi:hypothetical protein